MLDFLKFYPMGRKLIIECIPDKYIQWQPVVPEDIQKKLTELFPVLLKLNKYAHDHDMDQVVVINCDKAINFQRINYILLCKLVTELHSYSLNSRLLNVELRHCHPDVLKIYMKMRQFLPREILIVYFNE